MTLLLLALGLLFGSGLLAGLLRSLPRAATVVGAGGAMLGAVLGLIPAVQAVVSGDTAALALPWGVYGELSLRLDPLAAFFLLPILGLSGLAAPYGAEYLWPRAGHERSPAMAWLFYDLLVASMVLVVLAADGVVFLLAWETMSLASFFLVTHEAQRSTVRDAGWTYLVATHVGSVGLLVLFVLFASRTGSFSFHDWQLLAASSEAGRLLPVGTGFAFMLALVGFGTKAGFLPLHVWLPEAHPAAPSHVSAVMSGVMIKTGIYGLVRTITLLGAPELWWGWTLLGVGLASGVVGVLFALAQHDLKRLLAYSSVENVGIIAIGLGAGVLGLALNSLPLAVLGFAGGLLHVLNHALFKGLLFLGAGSVLHGLGTADIDQLGGLAKRMPWVAGTFLVGSASISALPPFNGLVSEFLIYLAAFGQVGSPDPGVVVPMVAVLAGLALIGGLAAACFAKAYGIVFLGEARTPRVATAHDPGWAMRLPQVLLAAGCLLVGLFGGRLLIPLLAAPLSVIVAQPLPVVQETLTAPAGWLDAVAICTGAMLALIGLLVGLRRLLLAGRSRGEAGTWDCGYARPTARMQYTASSFAQPLTSLFDSLLRTERHLLHVRGLFPERSALHTHTPDVCRERFYAPLFRGVYQGLGRLTRMQHGGIHLYVLYIVITLLVLLLTQAGR